MNVRKGGAWFFSEAHSERTRGNITDCSNGNFSSIAGENFSQWEWLRSREVVKLSSLKTSNIWLAKTLGNMTELLSWCSSEQEKELSDLERALPAWISLWFCKSKLSSISSYFWWEGQTVFRKLKFPLKLLAEKNLITHFPLVYFSI